MKLYDFTVTDSLGLSFAKIWATAQDAASDQEMAELQWEEEPWPPNYLILVDYAERVDRAVYYFEVWGT